MKKVKNKLEKRLLLNLYYMLIYPYLTYCNTIWGRAPNVYLDKTYILQKTIVRIISHVGFFDHRAFIFNIADNEYLSDKQIYVLHINIQA